MSTVLAFLVSLLLGSAVSAGAPETRYYAGSIETRSPDGRRRLDQHEVLLKRVLVGGVITEQRVHVTLPSSAGPRIASITLSRAAEGERPAGQSMTTERVVADRAGIAQKLVREHYEPIPPSEWRARYELLARR